MIKPDPQGELCFKEMVSGCLFFFFLNMHNKCKELQDKNQDLSGNCKILKRQNGILDLKNIVTKIQA